MQNDFDVMSWGPWATGLTDLLTHAGGPPVHLQSQAMLGKLLTPWFIGRERTAPERC